MAKVGEDKLNGDGAGTITSLATILSKYGKLQMLMPTI